MYPTILASKNCSPFVITDPWTGWHTHTNTHVHTHNKNKNFDEMRCKVNSTEFAFVWDTQPHLQGAWAQSANLVWDGRMGCMREEGREGIEKYRKRKEKREKDGKRKEWVWGKKRYTIATWQFRMSNSISVAPKCFRRARFETRTHEPNAVNEFPWPGSKASERKRERKRGKERVRLGKCIEYFIFGSRIQRTQAHTNSCW